MIKATKKTTKEKATTKMKKSYKFARLQNVLEAALGKLAALDK